MSEKNLETTDVVLVVEDESAVLKTFVEWLDGGNLGVRVITAADANTALQIASNNSIDLAILDWNLGAGLNGLDLLEDIFLFQPDVVAILVTGYANQATPLHAMKIGVRDYLDKTRDLTREKFLESVSRQLEKLRPQKNQKKMLALLERFQQRIRDIIAFIDTKNAMSGGSFAANGMEDLMERIAGILSAKAVIFHSFSEPTGSFVFSSFPICSEHGKSIPISTAYASLALAASCNVLKLDLLKTLPALGMKKNSLEETSSVAWFVILTQAEKPLGVLEVLDPMGDETELRKKLEMLGGIISKLVFDSDLISHSRNVLLQFLEKTMEFNELIATGKAPGIVDSAINQVVEKLGLTRDQLNLIQAVQNLTEKSGVSALKSCTAIIQSVGGLLEDSMREIS